MIFSFLLTISNIWKKLILDFEFLERRVTRRSHVFLCRFAVTCFICMYLYNGCGGASCQYSLFFPSFFLFSLVFVNTYFIGGVAVDMMYVVTRGVYHWQFCFSYCHVQRPVIVLCTWKMCVRRQRIIRHGSRWCNNNVSKLWASQGTI